MNVEAIMCTWCEKVSTEKELEVRLDNEYCPQCGESGCLLDIQVSQ